MKQRGQRDLPQLGVNLIVPGRAVVEQADERIRWHKRSAAAMEAELKLLSDAEGAKSEEWNKRAHRAELRRKIDGHLEYVRFLTFVRAHVARSQTYRLSMSDMSLLEITPKGSYL